jgi:hypothetical protein
MYDIKYFFSIKLNRQFGGQKNFQRNKLPKTLPKNTIFQNPKFSEEKITSDPPL